MKKTIICLLALFLMGSTSFVSAKVLKGKLVKGKGKGPVKQAVMVPLKGPKKLVAVESFDNKVENPNTYWYRNPKLGNGMSDMLVTALMDSNAFIVLEREKMKQILAEQDLAASGRTTKKGHAKIGKINQAQVLISGAVTMFEENTKKSGGLGGFAFKNVAIGLGGGGSEAQVAVDMRLYDTANSQVIAAKSCKGYAKSKGKALSLGLKGSHNGSPGALSFGGANFEKTPLGDASRDAINACVNFIATEMNKVPWSGRIIKVSPGKIYINCGARNNINVGETFSVFDQGESLVDPDTGEELGSEETFLGVLSVITVKEKFAICTKVSGPEFQKNNIIRWKEA